MLEEIREIRLSERRFYQKVTDIYATSIDYNKDAPATRQFFAKVQNKLHYSIHGQTAPELIRSRADSDKKNMGLTHWEKGPEGKIIKSDVSIAKNYLTQDELNALGRIVNAYLDLAEDFAQRKIPHDHGGLGHTTEQVSGAEWERDFTNSAGKISAEVAKAHAESEFEKYRIIQDRLFESDFDRLTKRISQEGKGESNGQAD